MIGSFEIALELMGTVPGGPVQATVPVTAGTLRMDRSWAPAVQVRFGVPFNAFDLASWQLIEPTLSAKFCRLEVQDTTNGRIGSWKLNLRSYTHNVETSLVEIVAYSYEAVVQDYGISLDPANYTDVAAYPSSLSIVQALCQLAAGSDAAPTSDWTAAIAGAIGTSNEYRFMVPGTAPWDHLSALAAAAPGGIVQHYGYGNNSGDFMDWLLTHPTYEIAPSFSYTPPAEPDPDLGPAEGSAELVKWQAERSREADGWGDAAYIEYPAKQHTASVVFTTSGFVLDYEYNFRGVAGSTSAKRRQTQDTSTPYSTPTDRNAVASQRLTRAAPRAVGQTFTQPLDVRLLPWQVHQDENSVSYMITSVMHNFGDGTSVVTVNRTT